MHCSNKYIIKIRRVTRNAGEDRPTDQKLNAKRVHFESQANRAGPINIRTTTNEYTGV